MSYRVFVLSRPSFDGLEVLRYLSWVQGGAEWRQEDEVLATPPESLVEFAGRVCYDSWGSRQGRKSNEDYLANILESGHGSVIEHANWSLLITGVSRSLTHELVRHRHFSISQRSQRYVDESESLTIIPPDLTALTRPPAYGDQERRHKVNALFTEFHAAVDRSRTAYGRLVEGFTELLSEDHPEWSKTERRKAARGAARSVLPNATMTELVVTANARSWRHFIALRGGKAAEIEIRTLAHELLEVLQRESPRLFAGLELVDGSVVDKYQQVS